MAQVSDIGIDLGASNVIIYATGRGVVLNEPAYVAVDHDSRNVIALGAEAYKMLGRAPGNIDVIRPLQGGSIVDYQALSVLLNHFVTRVTGKRVFSKPRAVLSVSCLANEIEKRELTVGMFEAGARRTQLLERPVAAAVGGGVKTGEHIGQMVADIGGATTDIGVIASNELLARSVLAIGGDAFTEAIMKYIRLKHNLIIGFRTADDLKQAIGGLRERETSLSMPVAGRNLVSGLPKQLDITAEELMEAMDEPKRKLLEGLQSVIEQIPPELANDVFSDGVLFTGGGARIAGLEDVVQTEMRLPCKVAANAQDCVAIGCGYTMEYPQVYGALLGDKKKRK